MCTCPHELFIFQHSPSSPPISWTPPEIISKCSDWFFLRRARRWLVPAEADRRREQPLGRSSAQLFSGLETVEGSMEEDKPEVGAGRTPEGRSFLEEGRVPLGAGLTFTKPNPTHGLFSIDSLLKPGLRSNLPELKPNLQDRFEGSYLGSDRFQFPQRLQRPEPGLVGFHGSDKLVAEDDLAADSSDPSIECNDDSGKVFGRKKFKFRNIQVSVILTRMKWFGKIRKWPERVLNM